MTQCSMTPFPFMRISNLKYRTHLYVDGIQTEGGRHWSPLTSDQIRGLLRHHDGWGVKVAADNAGHDARVNYPQSFQSENLLTANKLDKKKTLEMIRTTNDVLMFLNYVISRCQCVKVMSIKTVLTRLRLRVKRRIIGGGGGSLPCTESPRRPCCRPGLPSCRCRRDDSQCRSSA